MGHTSVCSAPGKVMLAGGYLILDRPHTGAVLALDQRFYSMVTVGSPTEALQPGQIAISVASPQFGELRRYVYASGPAGDNPSLRAVGESAQRPNRYIEVPLLYTLTAARALASLRAPGGAPPAAMALDITLAADNGFYSQVGELQSRGLPLTADSLASLPPLLKPMAGADGEVAKTGLGSSATLVTSLVAALLHALGIIVHLPGGEEDRYSWPANLDMVHSLAQLCHCAAQGKVGSGFDVCAATFGSQRYCRFSPAILQPVLQLPDGTAPPPRLLLLTVAPHSDGRSALDHRLEPFQLPPGIEIMMADVCCGANTPSMVRRVAAWRASHPDAAQLWTEYGAVSLILQSALIDLIELQGGEQGGAGAGAGWAEELARLGGIAPSEWEAEVTSGRAGELGSALCEVRSACLEMRSTVSDACTSSSTALLEAPPPVC
jgi:phosphomevalonate kinase